MIYFTIVIIVLLVALRMIVKPTAKPATKPVKVATLNRHENAIGRATDRMGW